MSLVKCYWMLQNARVTAFTVSELLRENHQGAGITLPPRLGLNISLTWKLFVWVENFTLGFIHVTSSIRYCSGPDYFIFVTSISENQIFLILRSIPFCRVSFDQYLRFLSKMSNVVQKLQYFWRYETYMKALNFEDK